MLEKFKEWLFILCISCTIVIFGNTVNTLTDKNPDAWLSPLANIPGVLILLIISLIGLILAELVPAVHVSIWITLIGVLLAMPYNTITGPFVAEQVGKIGLLPLATPILAYAGVSIGKDWVEFKKIGWRGIIVAFLVMVGTYVGSAIIAQIILKAQGLI
ncbi:MAG: hypothetical protein IIY96_00230 [Lachnospiraceae bacterium]|jgi:hypothetical protein|nr:hypothetical protein [Lachnospiraceae bacterium]